MSNGFNADEIFEIALEFERQGVQFYTKASEMFEDPEIRSMLASLAAMEAEHEQVFSSMRARLVGHEGYSQVFDPDGTASSYLRAITGGEVFDVGTALIGSETLADILKMGIEAEKNSVVFYTGLKSVVPENLGRDKVEKIIEEEMNHIGILSDKLSSLKKLT
jgi:rubrerythrin